MEVWKSFQRLERTGVRRLLHRLVRSKVRFQGSNRSFFEIVGRPEIFRCLSSIKCKKEIFKRFSCPCHAPKLGLKIEDRPPPELFI